MVHTERRKRAVSGKGRRTYQERLKNMADIGLWRQTIVCIAGLGAGILVSAGVFTVLLSVGLVPRFAGKTHTGEKIFLYEEMIVLGTLTGCFWSVYPEISRKGFWLAGRWIGRAFGEGVRGGCGRCFIYFARAVCRRICRLSGAGGGGDAGFYPDIDKKDRLSSRPGIDGAGSRAGKADGKPAVFWLPDFYGRMRTDSDCQRSVFAYKRDGKENHNL